MLQVGLYMNQSIFEQYEPNLENILFMFVLANEPNSSISLDSINNQVNLKYKNVFMKKHVTCEYVA